VSALDLRRTRWVRPYGEIVLEAKVAVFLKKIRGGKKLAGRILPGSGVFRGRKLSVLLATCQIFFQ
jgi:hypothetical protein